MKFPLPQIRLMVTVYQALSVTLICNCIFHHNNNFDNRKALPSRNKLSISSEQTCFTNSEKMQDMPNFPLVLTGTNAGRWPIPTETSWAYFPWSELCKWCPLPAWCLTSVFLLKNTNYFTSLKSLPSWLKASKNMHTYGCLIRKAIVTPEVFFFISPMQGVEQWYSVYEFLMQVVAPYSYHGCSQANYVPYFEITLYLCHFSHVPFPYSISRFSCTQKFPANPTITHTAALSLLE